MAVEASAPSATSDPGVVSLEPVEEGQGANRQNQVQGEPKPDAVKSVDLKTWAKTSARNRELEAANADLAAKLEAATKNTSPENTEAALLEALKQPGVGKLLQKAGKTFEDVIAEFTNDESDNPIDPRIASQLEELNKLKEKDKKREEDEAKRKADEEEATNKAHNARGIASIAKFATDNQEMITDEKDPRAGTLRWAWIGDTAKFHEEAHAAVIAFLEHNQGKISEEKMPEISRKLVEQALDKIELRERPKTEKLSKLNAVKRTITSDKKDVRDTDWREKKNEPPALHLDRSLAAGPAPTATPKKKFSSGPTKIKFGN